MKGSEMPVVTVPLVLFCDDTSGNKSKKWNKFIEWNLTLAGGLCLYVAIVTFTLPMSFQQRSTTK